MTIVGVFVVTRGSLLAGQIAFGRFRLSRTSAGHLYRRPSTAALQTGPHVARITRAGMAQGFAFVLGAGQRLVAHLVAGRTLPIAALSVAKMEFASAQLLAFGLAAKRFAAADFARLEATEAALLHNFFALKWWKGEINQNVFQFNQSRWKQKTSFLTFPQDPL